MTLLWDAPVESVAPRQLVPARPRLSKRVPDLGSEEFSVPTHFTADRYERWCPQNAKGFQT
jgi:hypothetical protein